MCLGQSHHVGLVLMITIGTRRCMAADKALHPPVGAFLRPVGHYLYCMRVTAVRERPDGDIDIDAERWGLEQDRPLRDGHQSAFDIRGLRRADGAWDSPSTGGWADHVVPRSYRLMDSGPVANTQDAIPIARCASRTQMALF